MPIIDAGFGLVGLSRVVVGYLIEDDITKCLTHLSVKDVPDFDIQSKIKELIYSHCKDVCLQCRDLYWSRPRFKALR